MSWTREKPWQNEANFGGAGDGRCLQGSQMRKTKPISGERDTDLTKPGRTGFDWSLSRLRAIMAACRWAFHNRN